MKCIENYLEWTRQLHDISYLWTGMVTFQIVYEAPILLWSGRLSIHCNIDISKYPQVSGTGIQDDRKKEMDINGYPWPHAWYPYEYEELSSLNYWNYSFYKLKQRLARFGIPIGVFESDIRLQFEELRIPVQNFRGRLNTVDCLMLSV